jgi:hypothetical protein
MKNLTLFLLSSCLFLASTFCVPAQGTAFTYQGRLNDGAGPATGVYDLRFAIYDALTGGSAVSTVLTNPAIAVSNGLFIVTLDFGPGVFTGPERWLGIGVRTNGSPDDFMPLVPRQPITATPYAIFSSTSGSVSNGLIQNPLFLGTTGNTPLDLFAGSQRALRLEPNTNGAPNVIGGSAANQVAPGIIGATISGGGAQDYFGSVVPNTIFAEFSTIGGGLGNTVQGAASIIAGGVANWIQTNAYWSAISGGGLNIIEINAGTSAIGGGQGNIIRTEVFNSSIVGGRGNTNAAGDSVIGGGVNNLIEPNAGLSSIGGGWLNVIHSGADQSVIAGGNAGKIYNGARESFIGGGFDNKILPNAVGSFIGAGLANSIGTNSAQGAISGGLGNSISNNAPLATVGGGNRNVAGGYGTTVSGGRENHAAYTYATIGGGYQNFASGNFNGSGDSATVAGGYQNAAVGNNAVVAGGYANYARGDNSAIAGGWMHTNLTAFGVIGGGQQHLLEPFARFSVIAGGDNNSIRSNSTYAVIAGGQFNSVGTNALYATIAGGLSNSAAGAYSFAAGRRAKAMHPGAFVWADSQDTNFVSTASNQFLVRASGGVGIGVTNPTAALHVAGTVKASAFEGSDAPLMFATGNNQPLEFKANGLRALRLEYAGDSVTDPDTIPDGAPNVIGGAPNNLVAPGIVGATIAGGGATNLLTSPYPNIVAGDFGAIGGGAGNTIGSNSAISVIAGGFRNNIATNAGSATIGGGQANVIGNNAPGSTIAGGGANEIGVGAQLATIAGGNLNRAFGSYSVMGGGRFNTNRAFEGTIAGGGFNRIEDAFASAIGGGTFNLIETNAEWSVVAGGNGNQIYADSRNCGIASGNWNIITNGSHDSVIAGGEFNSIVNFGQYGALLGGRSNLVESLYASVGGGLANRATSLGATVPGGSGNTASGSYSFAAGHRANANHAGSFVWADYREDSFGTTFDNQFLIRADFIGFNRSVRIGSEYFGVRAPVTNTYGGMYMETAGVGLPFYGYAMAGEGYAWTYLDGTDGNKWKLNNGGDRLTVTPAGNIGIGTSNPAETLHVIGNIFATGTIVPNSDRNAKTDITPADTADILERVAALPIQHWRFKTEAEGVKHVGPMAQDFHAAFGLGERKTAIATVDADGVALAAIQGLNRKLEEKEARIRALEETVAELKAILTKR